MAKHAGRMKSDMYWIWRKVNFFMLILFGFWNHSYEYTVCYKIAVAKTGIGAYHVLYDSY